MSILRIFSVFGNFELPAACATNPFGQPCTVALTVNCVGKNDTSRTGVEYVELGRVSWPFSLLLSCIPISRDDCATTYLLGLSISAPDWNTLYAARMARNIKLSGGENGVRLMSRRMYSSHFHSVNPRVHLLLYRPVNLSDQILLPPTLHFNHAHIPPRFPLLSRYLSQLHPSALPRFAILLTSVCAWDCSSGAGNYQRPNWVFTWYLRLGSPAVFA